MRNRLRLLCHVIGHVLLITLQLSVFAHWRRHDEAYQVVWIVCAIPQTVLYARLTMEALARRCMSLPKRRSHRAVRTSDDVWILYVIPSTTHSIAHVEMLLAQLAQRARAECNPRTRFALLLDFRDSESARDNDDDLILDALRQGCIDLNKELADEHGERVSVIMRERQWSETEQAYIGWERKRGKVLELLRLLTNDVRRGTIHWSVGELTCAKTRARFTHLFVQDERKSIDPHSLERLIAAAVHPENLASVDARTNTVESGFGIFQPSAVVERRRGDETTQGDPTNSDDSESAWSDAAETLTYSDHARFRGTGLYDIHACARVLDRDLPTDFVLHHDFLEGHYAGIVDVPGATLIDSLDTYDARLQRGHRWMRGYVQLCFFAVLRAPVTLMQGRFSLRSVVFGLTLFELAITECYKLTSVIIVLAASAGAVSLSGAELLFFFPAIIRGSAHSCTRIFNNVSHAWVRRDLRNAIISICSTVVLLAASSLIEIALYCHEAGVLLDAVCRATVRVTLTRRRLLEWTTKSIAEPVSRRTATGYAQHYAVSILLGLLGSAVLDPNGRSQGVVAFVLLLWTSAPFVAYMLDVSRTADGTHHKVKAVPL